MSEPYRPTDYVFLNALRKVLGLAPMENSPCSTRKEERGGVRILYEYNAIQHDGYGSDSRPFTRMEWL